MGMALPKQLPLSIAPKQKRETRTQFAALVYRIHEGKVQFLLITTRRTKRWILPKGWAEDGLTPAQSAQKEAFEEAGVTGKIFDACLGVYSYEKFVNEDDDLPMVALVYPMKAKKMLKEYPEKAERRRKWFSRSRAAAKVREPELRKLIKSFDPKVLK